MPKRLFVDGFNLSLKEGTGVATYARMLIRTAAELGYETGVLYGRPRGLPKDRLAGEVAFFDEEPMLHGLWRNSALLRGLLKGVDCLVGLTGTRVGRVPLSGAVLTRPLAQKWTPVDHLFNGTNLFDRAAVSFALSRALYGVALPQRPDIFHWTYPLPLRAKGCANVYTIHDLVPLRLPYTTLDEKRYYLRLLRKIAKTADHIVTVSEHSRRDIIQLLGVDEKRVTNTYQAVEIPEVYRTRSLEALASELEGLFGLTPRGYLLFYGALEPKKNVGRIVQAYLAANLSMPLVVVFGRSWAAKTESFLIDQVILDDDKEHKEKAKRRIRRLDYLSFPLLMTLARGARAVLFPSIYEGFGLPVLEAMSLGTPVVTSTESSLPEVAGDAALLVDPYDVTAIRRAIERVASDDDLCAELSRKGAEQAQRFSAEAYRQRIERLYLSLS